MNRLFRLLPLASLVLTACAINTPPQGQGKSPDSRNGASTSRMSATLTSSRPAGRLPIFPMSRKCMPVSSGNKPARTATACC